MARVKNPPGGPPRIFREGKGGGVYLFRGIARLEILVHQLHFLSAAYDAVKNASPYVIATGRKGLATGNGWQNREIEMVFSGGDKPVYVERESNSIS